MIVNYSEQGWEVITQRCHGIVAAQLAIQWKISEQPSRWLETLLAIAEHDDAEVELDGESLLTEKGGPLHFSMKTFDFEHCKRLSMLSQTKSRYISLLISMHMDFLYRSHIADNPAARSFLKEQNEYRKKIRKELSLTEKKAEEIYCLMEWFDACSLLICQRQLPPEKRSVEISHSSRKVKHYLMMLDDSRLTVDPWPFQADKFEISFESRMIEKVAFKNSEEFRSLYLKAPVKQTIWKLQKAPAPSKPKSKKI